MYNLKNILFNYVAKENIILDHLVRGKGALLRHKITDTVSPENVRDVWNKLTDMTQATRLNSIEVIIINLY